MLHVHMGSDLGEPARGTVALESALRPFKSGAEGYFVGGKVVIDGLQYQVSCNVIRIGSALEPEADDRRLKVMEAEQAKEDARAALAAAKAARAAL